MTPFGPLLASLDGSQAAARVLGCATWLARSLEAQLLILSATPRSLPAREELIRLRVPETYWPLIMLHQAPSLPEELILTKAAEHETTLVIMSAQGETAERPVKPAASQRAPGALGPIGHVARAVIEQSAAPVLLLPRNYREALPWKHVLVPMCGEAESDVVLSLAVTLAQTLRLELHVLHVLDASAREHGLSALTRYADATHHEYPQQLAELVRRPLPHHTPEDYRCITDVALSRGDVATQLLEQMEKKQITLLVIGWHGRFIMGHANVLKKLLPAITCPVLLAKPAPRPAFRLKVGPEID